MSHDGDLGRILVVDDEEPVRDVLCEYFEGQGFGVEAAPDGEAALAALSRQRPDLVLLDVRMPGLDGVEVLRRIRLADPEVPVIMSKPFDFSYLDRAVTAGLLQGGAAATTAADTGGATTGWAPLDGPWPALAQTIFRVVRGMAEAGRSSTGTRMESVALAAVRLGESGQLAEANQHLRELTLLLRIAAELGDLTGPDLAAAESALASARRVPPAAG